MLSLHCTRSAAAYKIYRTPNDRAQPDLWTEIVNACPIIDRLTRPILPSSVPNGEDSAANGWIDVGWEDVTGTLSRLSLQQFSGGVRLLIHMSDFCSFRTLLFGPPPFSP